jgi:Flp pilus assembly protein TadB
VAALPRVPLGRRRLSATDELSPHERAVASVYAGVLLASQAAILVGVFAAVLFASVVSAGLMLAGLAGFAVAEILFGVFAYRRVMRRPWPKVPPLVDDDDDW